MFMLAFVKSDGFSSLSVVFVLYLRHEILVDSFIFFLFFKVFFSLFQDFVSAKF